MTLLHGSLLTRNACVKRNQLALSCHYPLPVQSFHDLVPSMTYSIISFCESDCPQAKFIYDLHMVRLHIPFSESGCSQLISYMPAYMARHSLIYIWLDRIPDSPYMRGENCSWVLVIWMQPVNTRSNYMCLLTCPREGITHAPWLRIQLAELQFQSSIYIYKSIIP